MKFNPIRTTLVAITTIFVLSIVVSAQQNVTNVIFSSNIEGKDPEGFGDFIRAGLEAEFADSEKIHLLDRENLAGILSETQRREVAEQKTESELKIQGAQVGIYPKISIFKKQMLINFKIVDLSTSKYKIANLKAQTDANPLDLIADAKLEILQAIDALKIKPSTTDTSLLDDAIPTLPAGLTVALRIPEMSTTERAPDPAADKFLSNFFISKGVSVYRLSMPSQSVRDAAKLQLEGEQHEKLIEEAKLNKVDVLILGEAVSDPSSRFGAYHTAKARVELSVVRVSDSKILASTSAYGIGTDLSQFIAEKKAIEEATKRLAAPLTRDFVTALKQD